MTNDPLTTAHNDDTRRKKLTFRAWHRGTREADLLMGRFAEAFLPTATAADMDRFDMLLTETDPDIYDWVTGRLDIPANNAAADLLHRLRDFYKAF